MKKRKIKLFASIASLAMVVAVMAVGVWAATSQSLSVISAVKFTATGIAGSVTVQADNGKYGENNANTYATISAASLKSLLNSGMSSPTSADTSIYGTAVTIKEFALSDTTTATSANLAFTLDDGGDGIVEANNTFTLTYVFTNTGDNDYSITPTITSTNLITYFTAAATTIFDIKTGSSESNNAWKVAAKSGSTNGSTTVVFTFTVASAIYNSVNTGDNQSTSNIPSISFALAKYTAPANT